MRLTISAGVTLPEGMDVALVPHDQEDGFEGRLSMATL